MTKAEFLHLASQDFDQWTESQKDQSDAYEYERSLDELMAKLGQRILQMSVGPVPSDYRKKNDSHPIRPH